ncbi:ferrochelatase [Legionella sp. CNM-4043-24]|uniref:ferrochelatase n=1 Tax=Legionella sp. CNM-4043-24 TaxID=3421646 RepID=UPI00403AD736
MKQGLLLINLGTPDTPETGSVRRYLREFLIDRRVIDLPAPLRYLLVYAFILPFRPRQSAHAYQEIWTDKGSPLMVHSEALLAKVKARLKDTHVVALGMRYGQPSIASALQELSACEHLTVLPLYPQYSSAATGSSIEAVLTQLASQTTLPSLRVIRDFYVNPGFITAQAARIKPYLADHDYLLFSYHGIPERHLERAGCQPVCAGKCPPISSTNASCYRAQCQETSLALARALNLNEDQFSSSFQSRLGKTPWIKPYTDFELPELAKRGIRRLAIACPSFVADCLETLEEIGMRAKAQWLELGGESLSLIPCVNDDELWVDAVQDLVAPQSGRHRLNDQ